MIKILSEDTINKIAAGEVIERPANVVKELTENSLDAGARSINIEIEDAGLKLIRVSDDGIGMSRQDMTLSLQRHATSKITGFNDLEKLTTMGFRGEALPSIAAVSNITLQSSAGRSGDGWKEVYSAGKLLESKACGCPRGTSVEVRNLFFNTPARRKFMKSEPTEKLHITKMVEEMALVRNDVSFTLVVDGKNIVSAPVAASPAERLTDILGPDSFKKMVYLEGTHPQISITGFITKLEESLSNRSTQYLFVNTRPVNLGKLITHSLNEAYREMLPKGRYPGAVLFIAVDPSNIDVNIHPTKREVKFSKEKEVHDFVYSAIRSALSRPAKLDLKNDQAPPPLPRVQTFAGTSPSRAEIKESSHLYETKPSTNKFFSSRQENEGVSGNLHGIQEDTNIRPLGQIFNTYALVQYHNDFLIIDQHAAAERVRYERYLEQFHKNQITSQPLLIPVTIDVPPSQALIIKDNSRTLRDLGWDIAEFGKNTLKVSAYPNILGADIEITTVVGNIIGSLSEEKRIEPKEKIEKLIRAACRASIKANDQISNPEILQLAKDLFKCNTPYTCPHGRPTLIKLTKDEISRKFRRNE
jgi:DNA mismatch repair protein MutL